MKVIAVIIDIQQGVGIVPVEVKAGTRGQMQSMYRFMSERGLRRGIRVALEHFARYDVVEVVPLHAVRYLARPYRSSPVHGDDLTTPP